MYHIKSDEPTVSDPLILEFVGEYDVPFNQLIGYTGISVERSDYLCKRNATSETKTHYPYQISSTSSFVPG